VFDANIFYPAANSLASNEHLFGLSLFTLPVYALTRNPVLAYNVVWLASFVLNAMAVYALVRRHVRDRLAAFVGGLVFAFSTYAMLHVHGHLHLVWIFWIPLSLLALDDWYREPAWRRLLWLCLCVSWQALTSWYLAAMALFIDALYLAWLIAVGASRLSEPPAATKAGEFGRRHLRQLLLACALGAVTIWPFARHYSRVSGGGPTEIARYSATLTSYFIPPDYTWVGRWMLRHGDHRPRWIWGETTLYLGATVLVLTGFGAAVFCSPARHRPAFKRLVTTHYPFFVMLAVVAFALSLGPSTSASPNRGWMPFDLFARLPGMSPFRSPARFALLLSLSLAMLAASGAAAIHRLFGRRGWAMTLLLIPLLLSEFYVVEFPNGIPQPFPIARVYHYLGTVSARAVVSLPDYRVDSFQGADYLLYSTAHWHPIVNGYGRSEPAGHASIINHMKAFPGPNSARTMRRIGVDYVVLHAARYHDAADILKEAQHSRDFALVAQDGTDYLFRVAASPIP
jgi:hypothetical protein